MVRTRRSTRGRSSRPDSRFSAVLAITAVLVAACAACAAPTAGTRSAAAPIAPSDQLYVSIGDSYAAGYQPSGPAAGATTTNGFAYQLADRSAAKGTGMRLVNFGCSGVTSTGLLNDRGCLRDALAPGAPNYAGVPQAEAAGAFLRTHRGQVVLVTVVVGGNDVKPCLLTAQGRVRPDTVSCVAGAVATLRSNLARLLGGVRAAVGPNVRVVGLTYPDMFLGAWVSGGPDGHEIATRSVSMFRDALNPTLRAEYAKAGASFVDVTAASGAYGSMADSTAVPPYGPVPEPVAQACALTFYCEYGDPHPRTEGYTLIADLVQRTLPAS